MRLHPPAAPGSRQIAPFAALGLYAAFVVAMLLHHEPWADEAQAWQLATQASLSLLFGRLLHFEMTPGLWHVLLKAQAALGISYMGMHWSVALLGCAAAGLLLWQSPFPRWMRLTLPFTFFLAFQYSVVARSYSLVPVLLFGCAAAWRQRNPLLLCVLLALLANSCVQAAVMAFGILLVRIFEIWQRRRIDQLVRPFLWTLLPLAAILFAVWTARPPADAAWVQISRQWAHSGHISSNGEPVPESHRIVRLTRTALRGRWVPAGFALAGGVVRPVRLGLVVWLLIAYMLYRTRRLQYLWPVGLLTLFGAFTRFSTYHQGLMWLLLLWLLWVTWPPQGEESHTAVLLLMGVCIAIQIGWTARVALKEWQAPYAATVPALPTLQTYLRAGWEVDVPVWAVPDSGAPPAFFSVGLQPFFATQPFGNLTYRYWPWAGDPAARERYLRNTEAHRVITMAVLYEGKEFPDLLRLRTLGYRETHRFCAANIYPRRFEQEYICYAFFEPPSQKGSRP